MSTQDVSDVDAVRGWRELEYLNSLPAYARDLLSGNPAGDLDSIDAELTLLINEVSIRLSGVLTTTGNCYSTCCKTAYTTGGHCCY